MSLRAGVSSLLSNAVAVLPLALDFCGVCTGLGSVKKNFLGGSAVLAGLKGRFLPSLRDFLESKGNIGA